MTQSEFWQSFLVGIIIGTTIGMFIGATNTGKVIHKESPYPPIEIKIFKDSVCVGDTE